MIELPEAITLGRQINETLSGKTITEVFNANSPHKFTFFHGDPLTYKELLIGKQIQSARGFGIFVEIELDNQTYLCFNDGVNIISGSRQRDIPAKYQLLLTLNDNSFLAFTVAMYGGIAVFNGEFDNPYYIRSKECISPLSELFNYTYFTNMISKVKQTLSLKAFLATEQRIPGVGNGVTQDILFNARLNPKRKTGSLTAGEQEKLFQSIRKTLTSMVSLGGRDTETDLFGHKGGYTTILSKNSYKKPCKICGSSLLKESYLGGSIYYCPVCQPL